MNMLIKVAIWIHFIVNLLGPLNCQTNSNPSVRYVQNLSVHDSQAALEAASNLPVGLESATEPIDENKEDGLVKYAGVFGGGGVDYLQILPDAGDLAAVPAPPHIRVKRVLSN